MGTMIPMLPKTINPAAGNYSGSVPSATQILAPVSSAAPVLANPNVTSPLNTVQNNPFAAPTATAGTGIPAGVSNIPVSGVQNNGISTADGSYTLTGDLKDTYGAGTGKAIAGVLGNMGTVTDAAVQATINNTNLAAGKQFANIQAGEAAAGITPESSTAALAAGDFYTGVNSQLQSTIAGMELSQEDLLLQSLFKTGESHGPDQSTWDSIMTGITHAPQIAGAVSGIITGFDPTADTGILDAIAGL